MHIRVHDCSRIMQTMIYFMDLRALNSEIQSYVIDDCLKIQEYYQINNHTDIMNASLYTMLSIVVVILLRMLEKLASWYFKKKASQQQQNVFELAQFEQLMQQHNDRPISQTQPPNSNTPLISSQMSSGSKPASSNQSTATTASTQPSTSTQSSFPPNMMYAATCF